MKKSAIPVYQIKSFKKDKTNECITSKVKDDFISDEVPLQIALKKSSEGQLTQNLVITMRTPGSDIELCIGFLFTEGIIKSYDEIISVKQQDNKLEVLLAEANSYTLHSVERNFFTSSSCGICSKSSLKDIEKETSYLPFTSTLKLNAKDIFGIQNRLHKNKGIFESTGSLHASVLLDNNLNIVNKWEDIGRHNSLDKLIGHSAIKGDLPLTNSVLLLSGRISFELVQKAAMAGVGIIIAKGAPSSLAIEEAYAQSMSLIGFTKDLSYNVYCGFERIME